MARTRRTLAELWNRSYLVACMQEAFRPTREVDLGYAIDTSQGPLPPPNLLRGDWPGRERVNGAIGVAYRDYLVKYQMAVALGR